VLDDDKIASYKGKGVFGKGLQHYTSDIRKVEVLNEHEFKITFGAQITLELKAPDPKALKTWVACLNKKANEVCVCVSVCTLPLLLLLLCPLTLLLFCHFNSVL
jgi:hypothetical protein